MAAGLSGNTKKHTFGGRCLFDCPCQALTCPPDEWRCLSSGCTFLWTLHRFTMPKRRASTVRGAHVNASHPCAVVQCGVCGAEIGGSCPARVLVC